jgi:GT2 family glycosyltransferase
MLRELDALAASCLAKFRVPFTVLSLSHNMGYAPANNIGLRHARAPFVCFLNSDVFPDDPDWLEHMLDTAAAPDVGAVGALLVFEDGTVQHQGIMYERLQEFGGWMFGLHPEKGRFAAVEPILQDVDGLTGACLLMPTSLARELGGFDEGFVIGDFEDADLCKQVQARGLRCVLDRRAKLYHLERQSQGDQQQIWRTNLTLFNAWRFQRKWHDANGAPRTHLHEAPLA